MLGLPVLVTDQATLAFSLVHLVFGLVHLVFKVSPDSNGAGQRLFKAPRIPKNHQLDLTGGVLALLITILAGRNSHPTNKGSAKV